MLLRYLKWCQRWRWLILIAAAATFAGAAVLSSRLELRTDFAELLPSDDPGVVALAKHAKRIGDMTLLLIGIRRPTARPTSATPRRSRAACAPCPPRSSRWPRTTCATSATFFNHNQWLYVGEDELESIRDRLKHEIAQRKNPLLVDLGLMTSRSTSCASA